MSRWPEAAWRGPTPNQTSGHRECRGLVVHIASGFYDGTISWCKNPDANVSSHFVLGRDGQLAQLVDTDDTAWTQRDGNGHWLSVECEGFALDDGLHAQHPGWEVLTAAQTEAVARLLVHGHQQYGYPLTLAGSPTGKGLGYHSMGAENGYNWGHLHCPGEPIKAQLPAILARALVLAGATPTSTAGADMELNTPIPGSGYGSKPQTLDVGLALVDLTKSLDPYDTSAWQNEQLRNSRAILAAVQKLTAPPAVDLDALAEKVAAALVASNANGLTPADHAAVVEDVKTALRSGTAQ